MKKHFYKYAGFFLGVLFLNGMNCFAADTPSLAWTRQMGSAANDSGNKVAVDNSGNVFITGYTSGELDSNISAGNMDLFLSKFGSNGRKYWTKQIGSADNDVGYGIITDSSGYIYVAGITGGDSSLNNTKIIVFKYDTNGNKIWNRSAGTDGTNTAYDIAADNSGNIYVTGWTTGNLDGNTNLGGSDIFLIKYDSDGNKVWTKQPGSSADDLARSVGVDGSGNIYLTGYTYGGLDGNTNQGGADIFIMKYDTNGNKIWTKQMGTAQDDIANFLTTAEAGYLYITGSTGGSLDGNSNLGGNDILLLKYDIDGNKIWTRQPGTDQNDAGCGVNVASSGEIYVTGYTQGGLDGNTNQGGSDILIMKYDSNGNKIWTKQTGTFVEDVGNGIASDSTGNFYLTGYTQGDLNGNTGLGAQDIILLKYNPSTALLLSWPNEINYNLKGLYPTSGNGSALFTFKVIYTDAGNTAPKTGYPKVHIEKNGQEISGSPFTMQETDATAVDFTAGKAYQYQTTLPLGSDYAYWFEALNAAGSIAGGMPTGISSGPDVGTIALGTIYTYPNPAKAGQINFHIFCGYTNPELKIQIYNISGEKVATIEDDKFDRTQAPNYYLRNWNCCNDAGEKLASGIYIYQVEARDTKTNDQEKSINKFAIIR